MAVALTFPVTVEMHWFVEHPLKDLNQECFPNGTNNKNALTVNESVCGVKICQQIWMHQSMSDPVAAGAASSHSEQIFSHMTHWQRLVWMSLCTCPPGSLVCWLCCDRNMCTDWTCVPHIRSNMLPELSPNFLGRQAQVFQSEVCTVASLHRPNKSIVKVCGYAVSACPCLSSIVPTECPCFQLSGQVFRESSLKYRPRWI